MKRVNVNYAAVLGSYDVIMGSVWTYTTVYLLSVGHNTFRIGIIIALANFISAILQPFLADKADKSIRWTLYHFVLLLLIPAILFLGILKFFPLNTWIIALFYLLILAVVLAISPLLNSIGVTMINNNYTINYGVCRSAGSLMYGITSTLVGTAIITMGTDSVILVGLTGCLLILTFLSILNHLYFNPIFSTEYQEMKFNSAKIALQHSSGHFFARYPGFIFIVIGAFLIFISYNIIGNFMFSIVENVGGNSQSMGIALTFASFLEIPAMMLYNRFAKKMGHDRMLIVAAFFFFLRVLVLFLASNMQVVYFAQLFQSTSFGFYIVASVYYPNQIMHHTDKIKGQALLTTAHTFGAVVGSLFGGYLINKFSIKAALLLGIICTICGIILFVYSIFFRSIESRNG